MEKEVCNDDAVINVVEMVEREEEKEIKNIVLVDYKEEKVDVETTQNQSKRQKLFQRFDSLDQEASKVSGMSTTTKLTKAASMAAAMKLAFQSIGVVFGDIGTSPLYVFASTFTDQTPTHNHIIGALSLIIYSLTLFPLIKYVLIVLQANDNGDGGTFAMYSLICRHVKVSAIPSSQQGEEEMKLSAYKLGAANKLSKRAEKIKEIMEGSSFVKTALLTVALLGTCMVIGDGILTPCISVLSAVDGVRKVNESISTDIVVMISVAILVILFSIQRFGTDKVGYTFAPAILIWYLFIGIVGIFNLIRHDSSVLKAFNPVYIYQYFNGDPKRAWVSLGGVVLCMTGTEAMFADLGHFSVRSIQVS
ncbi:PREDICTED: potassium transporter 5-like [Nelumbo nucifera]|uniref:Potassium transporter 5-like n=1 Tax=Nelumbo nucifera TaxID=4432 RepID=A0A1U8QC47_NELNU|nr:PREDICTED: potassium transporter 5-like [Nelumbo nucifera]